MKKVITPKHKPTLWDAIHDPKYSHLRPQLKEAIKPFTEWMDLTEKKNIPLMFDIHEGDKKALKTLADKWRSRLWRPYAKLAREQGQEVSEKNYRLLIQSICFDFVERHSRKKTPIEKIWSMPGSIFLNIKKHISEQYKEEKRNVSLNVDYEKDFSSTPTTNIKIVKNKEGQDCILVTTAAEMIGVHPRTVEHWIKKNYLIATKEVYAPTGNPTYYIPYTVELAPKLRAIKDESNRRMKHMRQELYTVGHVVKIFRSKGIPLNRKLLERWENKDILVPKKISRTRYYGQNDLLTLHALLKQSKSSQLRTYFKKAV